MTSMPNSVPDLEQTVFSWMRDITEMRVFVAGTTVDAKVLTTIRSIEQQFISAQWSALVQQDAAMQCDFSVRSHCIRYYQFILTAIPNADVVLIMNTPHIDILHSFTVLGLALNKICFVFGESIPVFQHKLNCVLPNHGALQDVLDSYARLEHLGSRETRIRTACLPYQV
jgi:hypothetical protein